MVHSITSQHEIDRHINRILSPDQMQHHLERARYERSRAFSGFISGMGFEIKKFFVGTGK